MRLRHTFGPLVVGVLGLTAALAAALGSPPQASQAPGRPVVYAAVGEDLVRFDVDVEHATLMRRDSTKLHANVQEAALHPSGDYLYVGTSNGGSSYGAAGVGPAGAGNDHRLTAFRVNRTTCSRLATGPGCRRGRST